MLLATKVAPEKIGKPTPPTPPSSVRARLGLILRAIHVRLRFFIVLAAIFIVVGKWDTLWNYWETYTGGKELHRNPAVSADTEYWCPMCPGVISDWPAKCPVCNMELVKRKKNDPVPLPNGVMTRMQLSPFRIQLAGIKTSPITFQPLCHEIITGGFIQPESASAFSKSAKQPAGDKFVVKVEVFDKDIPFLREGQAVEMTGDAFPGRAPFVGKLHEISSHENPVRFQVEIADPRHELRPGMFLTARIKVLPRQWSWYTQLMTDHWRDKTCANLIANSFFTPVGPDSQSTTESLLEMAVSQAMLQRDMVLAVPESALVDTGKYKVAYVESGPGMFDGVGVTLGPKCGAYYPILQGLQLGQRVVTAGAFLIDAESRLNPAAASLYFGSGSTETGEALSASRAQISSPAEEAKIQKARNELNSEDRIHVDEQEYCPILDKNRLGSMGKPFKLLINGQPVYLCCQGCEKEALVHPDETLARVEALKRKTKLSSHRHASP